MIIEAFILCYNEEQMIRHTLNHYLQFCDIVNVLDNYSNDQTIEIIKKEYSPERVKILKYNSNNELNDAAYLYLKNNAWKKSTADWVIVCDMDELVDPENLRPKLEQFLNTNYAVIQCEGYNMFSEKFPGNYNIPIINQVQMGVRATNFDKSIIFRPLKVQEINYAPGAHTCNPIFYNSDYVITKAFKLFHYKYIGLDYLIHKHHQYAERLSQYNRSNNFGAEYLKGKEHVKQCFEIIKTSKLLKQVIYAQNIHK